MSVQIHINERPLSVEQGLTILQAARLHGIYIPTLCDFPGLPSHGSCRMCLVEIEGRPNTPTACTTPVEEGMRIYTATPRVQALRSEILQMLLSEHPSSCLFCQEQDHCDECMVTLRKSGVTTGCGSCPKDEQCTLQGIVREMVQQAGLTGVGYPIHYRMLPVEKFDPFFDRDYNLCVLCGRCIRVCGERHFNNILTYTSRGTQTVVGTAFHHTHLEAGCSFCGACVEVCPTGALSEKTRKWEGKPDGETASTCLLCSMGCQLRLLAKNNRVIGSLPNHESGTEALCVKGRFGITELVNTPSRLKVPQKWNGAGELTIEWEEAIQAAAEKLSACPPDRFAMQMSPYSTNEDLYVARKFTRDVMKTNVTQGAPAEAGQALTAILRESQPLSSLVEASTIVCIGLDGKYAQSVVEVWLHQAHKRGAKIITIHAKEHSLSPYTDEWLRPAEGEETALIDMLTGACAMHAPADQPPASAIERAASLLRPTGAPTGAAPAIIVGPDCLSHPHSAQLLEAIYRLAKQTGASLTPLPEQGNLIGAMLLGGFSSLPANQALDVLYLIGEAIPNNVVGEPYLLYQNMYPPTGSRPADLILPTTAFTETEGAAVDYAGRIQPIRPAAPAPGQALPSWQILCRIAQAMGAQGFDYASAADIQAEIAALVPGFRDPARIDWQAAAPLTTAPAAAPAHTYMGYPLTCWVHGLRSLDMGAATQGADFTEGQG